MESVDFSLIPQLTAERWQEAKMRAIQIVRESIPEPRPEHYVSDLGISKYPPSLVKGIVVMLIAVGMAAFWISAGKQIAAAGLVIDPISAGSTRLSPIWGNGGVVATLVFGEVGSILFLVCASVFDGKRWLFNGFAIGSAAVSVVANISITATHDLGSVTVFGWFITVMAPVTVLAVGTVIERLIMSSLEARTDQKMRFAAAAKAYQELQANPESHPTFKVEWPKAIYDELIRYKKDRELILPLSGEDKFELVSREYHTHMLWERYEIKQPRLKANVSTPVQVASGTRSGQGSSEAKESVRKYLLDNPEALSLSVRQLGEATGVSKSMAAIVLAEVKAERGIA